MPPITATLRFAALFSSLLRIATRQALEPADTRSVPSRRNTSLYTRATRSETEAARRVTATLFR